MSLVFGIMLFLTLLGDHYGNCSHFRGGTISWKPIHGQTVEFKFKMGWTFNSGPGCNENRIGEFVNGSFIGDKDWKCVNGCDQPIVKVGPAYYYCTAASKSENWEQGEDSFQYTFNNTGPFVVSYTGAMWMELSFGHPNEWVLQTTIDLRFRDDINSTNTSPITASKPLYTLQFSCYHELKFPIYDPDGDLVKCRWARGKECDSVCKAVPSADLDEDTCTLKFNASGGNQYKEDGWYAIALTIEDFPRKTIHVGNEVFNKTTALTTVPLQFLIHLVGRKTPCYMKPEFVTPTPLEGTKISIPARQTFDLKIYAANLYNTSIKITTLSLIRPAGIVLYGPADNPNRKGVVFWQLSWTPTTKDRGNHIVCGMAGDMLGGTSDSRCITLIAWDLPTDPCANHHCPGNLACSRIGSTQKVECICPVGFSQSGQFCTTVITTTKKVMTTKPTTSIVPRTSTVVTTKPTTMYTVPPTPTVVTTKPTTKYTVPSTPTVVTTKPTTKYTVPPTPTVVTTQPTRKYTVPTTSNVMTTKPTTWFPTRSRFTTYLVKVITSYRPLLTKEQRRTSSTGHGCFTSKSILLLIIFLVILLIVLAVGVSILIYELNKTKKLIRDLKQQADSFDIHPGK